MSEATTARAQAAGVLIVVALVGALSGVVGDRLLAQQRGVRHASSAEADDVPPPRQHATTTDSSVIREPIEAVTESRPPAPMPPTPAPEPAPHRSTAPEPSIPIPALPRPLATAPRYAERMASRLELTQAQMEAIDAIVEEERIRIRQLTLALQPQFTEIARQTQQRIEGVLTPEQRQQFRMLREARVQQTLELRARQLERAGAPVPPPPVSRRMLTPAERSRARMIQDSLNLPIRATDRTRLRQELRELRESAVRNR